MGDHRQRFIEFALAHGVLRFGDFTLKSGRKSPYFFNTALFDTGAALAELGRFYADAIVESGIEFDQLYGPAYKGIPLAAAVGIALADRHGREVPFSFNRKEAKDHGEGGTIVGAALKGRVLIVDDVISAGTAVGESVDIIRAQGAEAAAVVIALDRQERGAAEASAIEEVRTRHGIEVIAVVRLDDVVEHLRRSPGYADRLAAVQAYSDTWGA